MGKLYLAIAGLTIAAAANAQTPPPATLPGQPLLGSTLSGKVMRELPTGHSPFAVLETIQLEAISDRFATSVSVAPAPRVGGFLNSWTQTQFRIGDVAITDPLAGGTPLLTPLLPWWERITTATGAMGVEDGAPALSMTLDPPRPGATWIRAIEGSLSSGLLVSGQAGAVPAVDRLRQFQDGHAMVSGPATTRLGVVAAASWRGLSHVAAPNASATSDRVASGLAHLVFAASPSDEARALGWAQRVSTAGFTDTAVHVQATWERRASTQTAWRAFGGYTERSRTAPLTPMLVVDSLTSGPVSGLVDTGAGSAQRWVLGARVAPPATRWRPSVGIDLERLRVRVDPTGVTQIGELVDGVPSRMWTYHAGGGADDRHRTSLAVFGNEHVTYQRLTLDAGLRVEAVTGSADGAAQGIRWTTVLPRAMLRWRIADTVGLEAIAGYRRSAYQLPLNVLAIGDPAAPVADVATWNGTSIGPLIARVGPGTGGDPALTQIDPALRQPMTDELVLVVLSRPIKGLEVELARIVKRETPLLGFVNTGVAASSYTAVRVPDPSFLPDSPVGAAQVTAFSRPAGSYGRDRYLLTNQAGDPTKFWGLELTVRATRDRLTLMGSGALTWVLGPAAAVGFLPTENDQDVLGNMFVDPNAATAVRGQLFQDRSHVVKVAGVYRFPRRVSLGAILRYQDGQPFSRLVIAPTLTQGRTAVRSYFNGGSAFTYTATLDVRVQKALTAGRSTVTALLDVYNLTNHDEEVSEYVVTGTRFRTPTALQPPRTALAGVRLSF